MQILPKLFTIRWTQFTFHLLTSLLRSWHALMAYFDSNKDNDCTEMVFFRFLSKIENLRIIAFLADLLQIYSRYHKKTQDNKLTLVSLIHSINSLKSAIIALKEAGLFGGWEETLNSQIEESIDGQPTLKGFVLVEDSRQADTIDFNSFRCSIIDSVVKRLDDRFEADGILVEIIEPFQNFEKNANLREVHRLFGPDLDLSLLQLQYNEVIDKNIPVKLNEDGYDIIKALVKTSTSAKNYRELVTVLGRILVCTPHSADVERCISANNLLKTPMRNRIAIETENKFLYVYFNMPALEAWNPKSAINLFLNSKKRRNCSNVIDQKSSHASYFKGVFIAACDDDDTSNTEQVPVNKHF